MKQEERGNGAGAVTMESAMPQALLERIWAQRAEQFARELEAKEIGEQIHLVIVRIGQEFYGLEAIAVSRIRPLGQVTPVPRVPTWIEGIVNERGRILAVFDLRRFFGMSGGGDTAPLARRALVIVEGAQLELALLTDEVVDVCTLPLQVIEPPDAALQGIPERYVRGVAAGVAEIHAPLIVLDLQALLADDALKIREEG